jgi:hypothetical protein
MESPFAILGLPETASCDEVNRRFRSLALKTHPDKSSSPSAKADFQRINKARSDALNKHDPLHVMPMNRDDFARKLDEINRKLDEMRRRLDELQRMLDQMLQMLQKFRQTRLYAQPKPEPMVYEPFPKPPKNKKKKKKKKAKDMSWEEWDLECSKKEMNIL